MVIIAALYAVVVWLVFFQLKWLRWGWFTGTVTVIIGLLVCATFVGFLSYLAPTGRMAVIAHVVEVTPNVSGQITEISVQPNQLVKAGTVLFRIDPTPYDAQVPRISFASRLHAPALRRRCGTPRAVREPGLWQQSRRDAGVVHTFELLVEHFTETVHARE